MPLQKQYSVQTSLRADKCSDLSLDKQELGVYLDDLPLCLEKDRSLDMPEFVLWVLKLGEKIDIEELDELLDDEQDVEDSIPREATQ